MSSTRKLETHFDVNRLFDPGTQEEAFQEASKIVRAISPTFDLFLAERVYEDVQALFSGEFPGYRAIATPYHDRRHTLQVLICALRVAYGVHGRQPLTDEMIHVIVLGALLHDSGYAQREEDLEGTGAKYTAVHVRRSISFLEEQRGAWGVPEELARSIEAALLCTDHRTRMADLSFDRRDVAVAGEILGTGDLVGQMADRQYLEKLLFLYFEFQEAGIGDYQSMLDLLRKTSSFYASAKERLDVDFQGRYRDLPRYFADFFGQPRDFYLESIEKNLAYLERVIQKSEDSYLSMLRRGGIVADVRQRLR